MQARCGGSRRVDHLGRGRQCPVGGRSVRGGIDPNVTYAEQSGTSMAAPHVSGVIAGFLSSRPEFIGRPQQVKALLCSSATDLGRERYAQGHGLVDAMRMLSNS